MKTRTLVTAVALAALGSLGTGCIPDAPSPTTTAIADPWAPPQCWESTETSVAGLYYTGPENTLHNASYASRGDNCATVGSVTRTVVRAPDQAVADALCQSLTGGNGTKLSDERVDAPLDGWRCF